MKSTKLLGLTLGILLLLPAALLARDIDPIVSTDWLEKNLNSPKLVILDIRKVEEYKEGHVPGARNSFFGSWVAKQGDITNQLPEQEDLGDLFNNAGITTDARVVVVGKSDNAVEQGNMTRVAFTLKYAGVDNVAVLDGGYNKWVKDQKPVSTEPAGGKMEECKIKWNKGILADKKYVSSNMKKRTLADIRPSDQFFGAGKSPVVDKAGRIPGAVNLPPEWLFTKEGTWKSKEELEKIAAGVVGKDRSKKITTYCNTGIFGSIGWFLLSEVLGYKDVNVYDGSMQEWVKDQKSPLAAYSWK